MQGILDDGVIFLQLGFPKALSLSTVVVSVCSTQRHDGITAEEKVLRK